MPTISVERVCLALRQKVVISLLLFSSLDFLGGTASRDAFSQKLQGSAQTHLGLPTGKELLRVVSSVPVTPPAELLAEFANYFHYGYHECMKNLVHYLTTVERLETKDTKYARILAFLQSKARLGAEPAFPPLGSLPEPDFSCQLHSVGSELAGHSPGEAAVFPQGAAPGSFPWPHGAARSPALPYLPSAPVQLASPAQQHSPFLAQVQGLDRHYLNLIGHAHSNALNLHAPQHPTVL